MSDSRLVWSDEKGDLRKAKSKKSDAPVNEANIELELRRLTTGKGRTIIEITELPANKKWCQKLAKNLKKSLGVGGSYKNEKIEVHGEKMDDVMKVLEKSAVKYKKVGG